jgi:hypothetical protein
MLAFAQVARKSDMTTLPKSGLPGDDSQWLMTN